MQTLQALRYRQKLTGKAITTTALVLCALLLGTFARADVKNIEGLEFSRVLLVGSNELELSQGASNALKIRGDNKELSPLPFLLRDDTLVLGVNQKGKNVADLQYKVTVAGLEALLVEGSGEAYVKPLAVDDLLVSLEGSGDIRMFDVQALDLELRVLGSGALQAVGCKARDARLNMKGSGDVQLGSLEADVIKTHMAGSGDISVEDGGSTDLLEVRLMGSGDVGMAKVQATAAKVTIMGSGDVDIGVTKQLDVEILGSGDLFFRGSPEMSSSVLGSGEISRAD